jgi:putative oxidoreductase
MNNSTISRIGVILYALVIAFFGVNHFLRGNGMAGMVPSWVYLTGAALILAAIAFLTGKMTKLAGILLAVFLLLVVLTVHLPGVIHAPDEKAVNVPMINLIKDLGLAAGALMIAGRGN